MEDAALCTFSIQGLLSQPFSPTTPLTFVHPASADSRVGKYSLPPSHSSSLPSPRDLQAAFSPGQRVGCTCILQGGKQGLERLRQNQGLLARVLLNPTSPPHPVCSLIIWHHLVRLLKYALAIQEQRVWKPQLCIKSEQNSALLGCEGDSRGWERPERLSETYLGEKLPPSLRLPP